MSCPGVILKWKKDSVKEWKEMYGMTEYASNQVVGLMSDYLSHEVYLAWR
jgi:hypothetical protein